MKTALRLGHAAPARAGALLALAMSADLARSAGMRSAPALASLAGLAGGLALCSLVLVYGPGRIGLERPGLGGRLLGGLALGAVLLLPAAVRWNGAPALGGSLALATVLVSAGQEIAFRGVVFTSLQEAFGEPFGPAVAVMVTSIAFAAVHVFSHPVEFLPSVLAAGVLLGLWRWATGDLVAPVVAHVLANLAL